jgi:phosphoserine phosphatase
MSDPIGVDWDGTLADHPNWKPGAVDFVKQLQKRGFKVFIHSCRASYLRGATEIREALQAAGLKDVELVDKPLAVAYVDNRGVHCDGDYHDALRQILELT